MDNNDMAIFWVISSIFFLAAIIAVLLPLLKGRSNQNQQDIDQKALNIDIAKEQLANLETSYGKNEISKEEYDSLKYELESSLIDDIGDVKDSDASENKSEINFSAIKPLIIGIALFVPVFSMAFYHYVGEPNALKPGFGESQMSQSEAGREAQINQMLAGLINKLKENPENIEGWFLLARTFMSLERYDDAYQVYSKMLKMTDESPDVLVSMADALAMSQGGKMSGKPESYIKKALEKDPNHITGLWLSGVAAREKGDNNSALTYFNKVLPLLKDDEESSQAVKSMIMQLGGTIAQAETVETKTTAATSQQNPITNSSETIARVEVKVSIDPSIQSQLSPEMTVFIYAKATQGPPMPLAASKHTVSELLSGSLTITLNDQMAMMPSMKLSSFSSVNVGARISMSGTPMKRSGDFTSKEVTVTATNNASVDLIINTRIP